MDISVIIPAYNVSKYIKKCIESLLNQTFLGDYELIIINDGSTDSTLKVIKEYERNSKIRVIDQPNKGLSDSRNAGIKVAKGNYLMFIDADDYVSNTLLEDCFNNIGNSDILIFGLTKQLEDGSPLYIDYPKRNQAINEDVFWQFFYKEHPIICTTACTKIYKRSLFDNIQFPSRKVHEDVFVLHSIIGKCKKIFLLSKPLYFYIMRGGSITNVIKDSNALDLFDAHLSRLDYFLAKKDSKNMKQTLLTMISQYRSYCVHDTLADLTKEKIYNKIRDRILNLRHMNIKLPNFCKYFVSDTNKSFRMVLTKCRFQKLWSILKLKRT